MQIFRSIDEPIRDKPSFDERWRGPDNGLITCWEDGRKLGESSPELVSQVKQGELPVLGWKGGVEKKLKQDIKYGTLRYLAQLQGVLGEDLNVNLEEEIELVCSKTKQRVILTPDTNKYVDA